jgi:hypothetical protein
VNGLPSEKPLRSLFRCLCQWRYPFQFRCTPKVLLHRFNLRPKSNCVVMRISRHLHTAIQIFKIEGLCNWFLFICRLWHTWMIFLDLAILFIHEFGRENPGVRQTRVNLDKNTLRRSPHADICQPRMAFPDERYIGWFFGI